jgi:predicted regulator of Ras-like GTPase activity (Roadblock/LC7/MglB family)
MPDPGFAERRKKWTDRVYREVKERDPDAYRDAVQSADGLAINHNLPSNVAADIEAALMSLAHRMLK